MKAFHLCIAWLVLFALAGMVAFSHPHAPTWWLGILTLVLFFYTGFVMFRGFLRWTGRQLRGGSAQGR